MTTPDLSPKPFNFTNPLQKRIFANLQNLLGPGPALFYRDACSLMASESPIPSTTHLVAHLLREIESALRDVLETFVDPNEMKNIKKQSSEGGHKEEVLIILSALELSDDTLKERWLGLTGKGNIRALHSRAHRNALGPPRTLNSDFHSFWSDMELILNTVLDAFEAKYLKIHNKLDELKTIDDPTHEDVKFLQDHIPNNFAAFSYFFQDLDNPAWLVPLARNNTFSYPPAPIINIEENTVSHPLWPQSRYLLKMTSISPDTVIQIALEIETENSNVQSDLIDIACSLPAFHTVKLVPKFSGWFKKPSFLFLHKISPLITHLANNGEVEGALTLSKELLSFETVEDTSGHKDSKPRIQSYEFERFLKDTIPVVVKREPYNTFLMLMNLLADAVQRGKYDQAPDYRDYSEVWQPAVEPHLQNPQYSEPRGSLVSAVRDAATYFLETSPDRFQEVIQELEEQKWTVFNRLALHLLREFGDKHIEMVSKRILDRELFDNPSYYHEYMLLAGKYFGKLKPKEKSTFLGWIDSGAEDKDYKEYWQLRRLTLIKDNLPKRWKALFDSLTKKYGVVEHPDLLSWSTGVMSGPASPLSQEQIEVMSLEELISYLQQWKQPAGFTMESPEGISRTLTSVVTNKPERFTKSIFVFSKVHPTYVRGVLAGFREALKAGKVFDWEPILELMKWIVEQNSNEIPQIISNKEELDPNWGWTRMEISHLLEDALNNNQNPIQHDKHNLVWEIIEPITDDPDPSLVDEETSQTDPATKSLNTTRGMAFHALIAYALWRKRNFKKELDEKDIGFNEMPEVRKILDEHLDTQKERSLTIRSIYGWRFINLLWLDRNWSLSNKNRIFPRSEDERSLWNASWDAFISFTNPNADLFQSLQPEYQLAVDRLQKDNNTVGWGIKTGERLAEHLMVYYAWGTLELTSSLMEEFWTNADVSFKSHALHFIGTTVKEGASPDIVKRFQELWEYRLAKAEANNQKSEHAEEIKEFAWWFVSGTFPDNWLLNQLERVLNLSYKIEDHYFVFERLAALSENYPFKTIDSLEKLLEEETPWKITGSKEHIETVLRNALGSRDNNASRMAREFINRLAAKGYSSFTNLLD